MSPEDTEACQPMIASHPDEVETDDEFNAFGNKDRSRWHLHLSITFSVCCAAFFVALVISFLKISRSEYLKQRGNWKEPLPLARTIRPGTLIQSVQTNLSTKQLYDTLEFSRALGSTYDWNFMDADNVEAPQINLNRWTRDNKLKIFVVIFSHNDAGWRKTFQEYYLENTKHILDRMLRQLTNNTALKFTWTEISFFDLWWKDLNAGDKELVKILVDRKQLEFTADGWVMPDEATVHYASYLTQLFEGHQWLWQQLNYRPRTGWQIDPFGLSTTLNFLLQRAGAHNTVLGRIHYILKRHLRSTKSTEFLWRQQWDADGSTDIFSHLMPYSSYDQGRTCGPAGPTICYTFANLKTDSSSAEMLEQYRLKSMVHQTNNLLLPLGGDFHWAKDSEWEKLKKFENYMTAINSDETLNTEMKFATLQEYFDAVRGDVRGGNFKPKVLSGDFYPYADSGVDYWAGYFTSRIFSKVSERHLMSLLRAAQIAFTLATAEIVKHNGHHGYNFLLKMLDKIIQSRRALSLFQHHDGIAGTSKDYVVVDYLKRLRIAMLQCQFVLQQSLFYLNNREQLRSSELLGTIHPKAEFLEPIIHKENYDSRWKNKVYSLSPDNPEEVITIFNALEYRRTEVIKLGVSSPHVKVFTLDGVEVMSEIFPVFYMRNGDKFSEFVSAIKFEKNCSEEESYLPPTVHLHDDIFELNILVELNSLEVKNVKLAYYPLSTARSQQNLRVKVFHAHLNYTHSFGRARSSKWFTEGRSELPFQISNQHMSIEFKENGLAKTVHIAGILNTQRFNVGFYAYKSAWPSGLYSFTPHENPKQMDFTQPLSPVIVVEGRIKSYVEVWHSNLRHRVTLFKQPGIESRAVHVENIVDMRNLSNTEIVMRIVTDISSGDTFYTDSNGFQMMQRKMRKNLALSGNFYPVAAAAYIEDNSLRMTILSGQPCGGASLHSGALELMQDRRVNIDDGHGIGQGYTDNLITTLKYKIVVEGMQAFAAGKQLFENVPVLSLTAHHQLLHLLHPPQVFRNNAGTPGLGVRDVLFQGYSLPDPTGLPCDIQLVSVFPFSLKTNASKNTEPRLRMEVGLLFHRIIFDGRFGNGKVQHGCNHEGMSKLRVGDLFSGLLEQNMLKMSVSFVHQFDGIWPANGFVDLEPMEVCAFKATLVQPSGSLFAVPVSVFWGK